MRRNKRATHEIYVVLIAMRRSRELTRGASDGVLSRQPVSIGSDGVRLPTFSNLARTSL